MVQSGLTQTRKEKLPKSLIMLISDSNEYLWQSIKNYDRSKTQLPNQNIYFILKFAFERAKKTSTNHTSHFLIKKIHSAWNSRKLTYLFFFYFYLPNTFNNIDQVCLIQIFYK